jgi:hypothetical protein
MNCGTVPDLWARYVRLNGYCRKNHAKLPRAFSQALCQPFLDKNLIKQDLTHICGVDLWLLLLQIRPTKD